MSAILMLKHRVRAFALVCAAGAVAGVNTAAAQNPLLLILDETAVVYGDGQVIPADAANAEIASVGLRDPLPFFAARVGASVDLPSGLGGNDGWFAVPAAPASWATEGGNDGLENFFVAGPGLGSPDDSGNRTSLLAEVPNVVPLRTAGLSTLVGRRACAVVYKGDVAIAGDPAVANLAGPTLGVIAFEVTALQNTDGPWPGVTLMVLDVAETCRGTLDAYSGVSP